MRWRGPLASLAPSPDGWAYALLTVGALGWYAAVRHDPFFWDTVQLGSKHAHFFYENGLRWQPLPTEIDSGHPPLLGYYLALCWTLFGKTLAVSHAAVLPFAWGSAVLLWRLGGRLAPRRWQGWLVATVWLDPVVAGQMALVSPDSLVVFGCLAYVDGYFAQRQNPQHGQKRKTLAVVLLAIVSTRGMLTVAGLALFETIMHHQATKGAWRTANFWRKRVYIFAPGALLAAAFLVWHHHATGWTGYHPDSPWAAAFRPTTTLPGWVRNVAVLAWRWLDLGRVVIWGVAAWLCWQNVRFRRSDQNELWWLLLSMILLLSPTALRYENLSAHRYFLPVFLALHMVVFQGIAQANWPVRRKTGIFVLLVFAMFTGNRWIYPRGISLDWDSTLAHLPYHGLRAEAVAWLEAQAIPLSQVGSAFPNLSQQQYLLLNDDQRAFAPLDVAQNRYVLTSNVFNDLNAPDYAHLAKNGRLVWKKRRAGVEIMIFQMR